MKVLISSQEQFDDQVQRNEKCAIGLDQIELHIDCAEQLIRDAINDIYTQGVIENWCTLDNNKTPFVKQKQ